MARQLLDNLTTAMIRVVAMCLLALPAFAEPAVGRLNAAGYNTRTMCSGALIAPDLVVTGAHCVVEPESGALRAVADMVFVAGWDGAGHKGASRVAEVIPHPRAFAGGPGDLARDLALVRLVDPLTVTPMAFGAGAAEGPLRLAGYTKTRPHRLSVAEACLGTDLGPIWRVQCAVERGQSGGPVTTGDGDARRIVAVIAATSGRDALVVPLGPWLRRQVDALR